MVDILFRGLSKAIQTNDFTHICKAFLDCLSRQELSVDRIQIPMNKLSGLRHPRHAVILLTFAEDELDTMYIPHERFKGQIYNGFDHLRNTPFAPVLDKPDTVAQRSLLVDDVEFDRLRELKAEGYTEYAAINMVLPHGPSQLFSVATKDPNGLGTNVEFLIEQLLPTFSICLYGAYQSNVAIALAETYLGSRTGENVLAGSMHRGTQDTIDAGIMFCDVRGFTAMSEKLGAEGVVKVMNDVFQIIEEEVLPRCGEILKFIGDALLVVFPRGAEVSDAQVSKQMVHSALQSVIRVEELGRQMNLPLSVGFGCHLGSVLYGNIGTETRLDFTVMGPAVNLTSRLESMCKSLGAQLTVSRDVAQNYGGHLQSFGVHSVKGVAEPVEIWGVPVRI